ncbi:MAG: hypothetical protein ACP5UR_07605 [Chloroflexus sp.]|uniref:hypothetical protein n=1 Tax=Chloroflexus sp. TaxID=1904827 RepID=UPI003D0F6B03
MRLQVDQLLHQRFEWLLQNPLIPQKYKDELHRNGKLPPVEWLLQNPLIRALLTQKQKEVTQAFDQTLHYPLLIELS